VKVGGRRRGETLVYRVKSGAMARDGFVFWRAANGVWQSKYVPAAYLER
jgi:putative RNA 2'-phosphotransferase